mgnify:FL=1
MNKAKDKMHDSAPADKTHTQAPHALENSAVFETFDTSEDGLSSAEVAARLAKYGANKLPVAAAVPAWKRFLLQFHNVLIYILFASACISFLLEHFVDGGVILAVVIINAIVGFIQEGKAEQALLSIMTMTKTQCMAVRDGALISLDSAELVPGDIVTVQAGDRVPADIRLYFCKDLQCDESALTGESQPVEKHNRPIEISAPLAERMNMAFMGSMVTFGLARGVVCNTGLK